MGAAAQRGRGVGELSHLLEHPHPTALQPAAQVMSKENAPEKST